MVVAEGGGEVVGHALPEVLGGRVVEHGPHLSLVGGASALLEQPQLPAGVLENAEGNAAARRTVSPSVEAVGAYIPAVESGLQEPAAVRPATEGGKRPEPFGGIGVEVGDLAANVLDAGGDGLFLFEQGFGAWDVQLRQAGDLHPWNVGQLEAGDSELGLRGRKSGGPKCEGKQKRAGRLGAVYGPP